MTRLQTKTLDTRDLEKVASMWRLPGWRGAVLHGELPGKVATNRRPACWVFNLDRGHRGGTHWTAVHLPRAGPAGYFDSYGVAPPGDTYEKLEAWTGQRPQYNKKQMQAASSNDCGRWSLLYLLWRAHGGSPTAFREVFCRPTLEKMDRACRDIFGLFLRSAEVVGGGADIHKLLGRLPRPKRGWVLPGHRYTGPYNPLESQLDENDRSLPGQEPYNGVDAVAMRHDICYRDRPDDKRSCDQDMLQELRVMKPRGLRERLDRGLVRTVIGTKHALGLGA